MPGMDEQEREAIAARDEGIDLTGSGILAQARRHRMAVLGIGAAVAATAGAVYAAQAVRARRWKDTAPNSVLANAITANQVKDVHADPIAPNASEIDVAAARAS